MIYKIIRKKEYHKLKKYWYIVLGILYTFFCIILYETFIHNIINPKDAGIMFFIILNVLFISTIKFKKILEIEEENLIKKYFQIIKIFENSPTIMYLKDINGKIIIANQALGELFNCKSSELSGKNTHTLYLNKHKEQDKWIIKNKKILYTEEKIQIKTESENWYKVTKIPILNQFGNVIQIVVFLRNIEENKQIEERKNNYIATLTHDLKTPNHAHLRILKLLLNDKFGELTEEQKEIILQLEKSCTYMNKLISNILETYLSENGKIKIKYEKFNIIEIITILTNEIINLAKEREQEIQIINKNKEIMIDADKIQIQRVIYNLVSNAIFHGKTNTEIKIIIQENEKEIIFKVINKSEYIPEEELAEVYNKFKSSSINRKETGTGLGLYLSKKIITIHNGKMFAESQENGICTFGFSIPKQQKEAVLLSK